jgi:HEAT repeat protein
MTKRERRQQGERDKRAETERWGMAELPLSDLVEFLGDSDWAAVSAAWDELFRRGKDALDALVRGLEHPDARVRANCALLMDHLGDDRCAAPLHRAMRSDRREAVRRCAMHSLACQECKNSPLCYDVTGALIETLRNDRSLAVRRRALHYLTCQHPDARAADAARHVLAAETDPALLVRARRCLDHHEAATSA